MSFNEQDQWWNRPQDSQGAPPAPVTPPKQEPNPVEIVRQIAREEHVQQTQQYNAWAQKRNDDLQIASQAWVADKELAPYYDMARQEFFDLDQMFGQQKPVAEVVDMVKRKVMGWKSKGILAPAPKPRNTGFAPVGSNNYDINPDPTSIHGVSGFRPENPDEKMKANYQYLMNRRIDLDKRKFRGDDDELKQMTEMRERQLANVTIE